jgi:hypothetical protein
MLILLLMIKEKGIFHYEYEQEHEYAEELTGP